MGPSLTETGVNFAVFSAHATALELCLYDGSGRHEQARLSFADRTGDIWHMEVPGLRAGQVYGLRAHGPYEPEAGQRFNPAKLLVDPCARGLTGRLRWSDAVYGYKQGSPRGDLSCDHRDSGFAMPKSVVIDGGFDWQGDRPPQVPLAETVIYEAHVKALTHNHPGIPAAMRGRYAALGHPALISHLKALGVTAIELLPIHAFVDDRFLVERGLVNHWGYNTLSFFAPEPRFGTLAELKGAVRALHKAGIEVLLDVVYNHTAESDEWGPTLSFRGLDNVSYYRLAGGRHYLNDAGTGNTLNAGHPAVLRLIMDSLRYWVEEVHIDGFRFDLGSVLGRGPQGFSPDANFFAALRQDPVLAGVKLIAEPWDIGPGGYQLGGFPPPFSEWNDRFRDGVRRFWRGDAGQAPELARRLLGSAERFDHSRRAATASVNFITAHDGFTLADLTAYSVKRNFANGEENRDGHDDNHSGNLGVEGPTTDAGILAARALRQRNLMATLMLSQGVPMLLAGDELGHSQGGNNNAYAQDNATTWLNWKDHELTGFLARLTALRRDHPVLRQGRFLHSRPRADGLPDVVWRKADGTVPSPADWHDAGFRCIGVELRMAAEGPDARDMLYLVFNGDGPVQLTLPDGPQGWTCLLNTTLPEADPYPVEPRLDLPGQSVFVFSPLSTGDA